MKSFSPRIMINQNFEQKSLANLLIIRNLTERLGGGIKKSFGQNFLINQGTLFRFIDLLDITKDDTVIEIGPGIGVVSYTLCQRAGKVILIELDREKEQAIRKVLENFDNYELIFADASDFDYTGINNKYKNLKIIGSLPYNVGKRIIYNIFNSNLNWTKAAFILQKEVAENYSSEPPKADFLSMFTRVYAKPQLRFLIPGKHFYPIPKVTSAVITFEKNVNEVENSKDIAKLIRQGFIAPRKTILNNLKSFGITKDYLNSIGLRENLRPSQLTLENWINIYKNRT